MSISRADEFFPWEVLLKELQLKILDLLLLIDLEYFSYTSKASRRLYSDALPNQFRPEVIEILTDVGIALPIPPHAFLTPSELTPKTFVLKKPMADLLGTLIQQCNYQFLATGLSAYFDSLGHSLLKSHFNNHYLLNQIDFMLHLLLTEDFGIELTPDESKTPLITSDEILTATKNLVSPGVRMEPNQADTLRSAMTTFCNHLDSLQLNDLATRLRQRTQFRILKLEDREGRSPESTVKRLALESAAMDERSLFLGSLVSRSWSEKESSAKAELCNFNSNIYINNKRTAVAAYRRICALPESEAVFFQRVLFNAHQPHPTNLPRFDHAHLLVVLTALDKVAQHERGKTFISELFTVKPDDSTNFKLAVFKQLRDPRAYGDLIDIDLFSSHRLVNIFNTASSLHAAFNMHNLDPVFYASALLVLMSNFECPKPNPTATSAERAQVQQQAREQQRKRATFFLEVMTFIKQNDPDCYTALCGSLQTLLNDLFKEIDLGRVKTILTKHHYIVYSIGSHMLSEVMVNLLNRAINDNKLDVFFKSFRGWWESCEASVDRASALQKMKEISERELFLHAVECFVFQPAQASERDLTDNIHLLLHPDATLWCLPEVILRQLLNQCSRPPGVTISQSISKFLYGLALAKKERVLPRIQKFGPNFLILNEIAQGNNSWLFSLLFTLPNKLFEAILSQISPILQRAQTAEEKKADLNRCLTAALNDLPGAGLYLCYVPYRDAYFKVSHPLDDISGSELVKMNGTYLIDPSASKVQPLPNHNLFTFISNIIRALYNSDGREVQAIDINALVIFIISHATDSAFLFYLDEIKMLDSNDGHVDPVKLIKLDNYCRTRNKQTQAAALEVLSKFVTPSVSMASWSKKEVNTKIALCMSGAQLVVSGTVARRICALSEEDAVFFQQALLDRKAPSAATGSHRFQYPRILTVSNALDALAQHEPGKRFVQMLFEMKPDDSNTNYKLTVFKLLLLADRLSNSEFCNAILFSDNRMVDMFNTVCSLQTKYLQHNFDPIVYASILLVLMSSFNASSPQQQVNRATVFLETMVFLQQNYPDDYKRVCDSLQAILNGFYKANDVEATALLRKHHYIVYTISSYMISEVLVRYLDRAIASNILDTFFAALRGWWEMYESNADRPTAILEMKQIAARKSFALAVEYFVFIDSIYRDKPVLYPDSALWCLPEEFLQQSFDPSNMSSLTRKFLLRTGYAKKEEVLPRIEKLGPDFIILNQFALPKDNSWLYALLFMLPDRLFAAVLERIRPILHAKLAAEQKHAELERALANMSDIPGLILYLNLRNISVYDQRGIAGIGNNGSSFWSSEENKEAIIKDSHTDSLIPFQSQTVCYVRCNNHIAIYQANKLTLHDLTTKRAQSLPAALPNGYYCDALLLSANNLVVLIAKGTGMPPPLCLLVFDFAQGKQLGAFFIDFKNFQLDSLKIVGNRIFGYAVRFGRDQEPPVLVEFDPSGTLPDPSGAIVRTISMGNMHDVYGLEACHNDRYYIVAGEDIEFYNRHESFPLFVFDTAENRHHLHQLYISREQKISSLFLSSSNLLICGVHKKQKDDKYETISYSVEPGIVIVDVTTGQVLQDISLGTPNGQIERIIANNDYIVCLLSNTRGGRHIYRIDLQTQLVERLKAIPDCVEANHHIDLSLTGNLLTVCYAQGYWNYDYAQTRRSVIDLETGSELFERKYRRQPTYYGPATFSHNFFVIAGSDKKADGSYDTGLFVEEFDTTKATVTANTEGGVRSVHVSSLYNR